MSLGYLVRFFFTFPFNFYLTNSFLDILLVLRHPAPPFSMQWGNESRSRENAQEMSYDVSWAFGKFFFFFSFHFYITYSFFQITHSFSDIIHHLSTTTTARDDRRTRGMMRRTPKRRRTTSLGHVVCYFLLFPFISILLTFFLGIVHSFSDNHRPLHNDDESSTMIMKGGLRRVCVSSLKQVFFLFPIFEPY